jgi:hypothetical protein
VRERKIMCEREREKGERERKIERETECVRERKEGERENDRER